MMMYIQSAQVSQRFTCRSGDGSPRPLIATAQFRAAGAGTTLGSSAQFGNSSNGLSSACSNSLAHRPRLPVHCAAAGPKDVRYGWRRRGVASSDVDFFLEQVQRAAKPGTSWAPAHEKAFRGLVDKVGGHLLLVQSGEWEDGELKGQPALAVAHLLVCRVDEVPVPNSKTGKTKPLPPQLLHALPLAAANNYYVLGMLKLDDNNWPTGTAYHSPRSFEALTNRAANRSPDQANIVWEGEARETVKRWGRVVLEAKGLRKAPARLQYHLREWYHGLIIGAGGEVDEKMDAPARAKVLWATVKEEREQRGAS